MKLLFHPEVYEPREDSKLIKDGTLKFASLIKRMGGVIEIGVGSGYVLLHLADEIGKGKFIGTDTNYHAALLAQQNAERNNIDVQIVCTEYMKCFRKRGVPNVIVFNPPYLPEDEELDDLMNENEKLALVGGKKGTEVLLQFIEEMSREQIGFFVISSLATSFDEFVKEMPNWEIVIVDEIHVMFETLWLVKVKHK